MMKMFNRTFYQIEGHNCLMQPVYANDVALAINNALKMDESIGQTYDLCGPHTYNVNEIYEQFYNVTQIKPYIIPVKFEDALELMRTPKFVSASRLLAKHFMYPEWMVGEAINVLADSDRLGFKDLHVTPVSFGQKVNEYVADVYSMYNSHFETNREHNNG